MPLYIFIACLVVLLGCSDSPAPQQQQDLPHEAAPALATEAFPANAHLSFELGGDTLDLHLPEQGLLEVWEGDAAIFARHVAFRTAGGVIATTPSVQLPAVVSDKTRVIIKVSEQNGLQSHLSQGSFGGVSWLSLLTMAPLRSSDTISFSYEDKLSKFQQEFVESLDLPRFSLALSSAIGEFLVADLPYKKGKLDYESAGISEQHIGRGELTAVLRLFDGNQLLAEGSVDFAKGSAKKRKIPSIPLPLKARVRVGVTIQDAGKASIAVNLSSLLAETLRSPGVALVVLRCRGACSEGETPLRLEQEAEMLRGEISGMKPGLSTLEIIASNVEGAVVVRGSGQLDLRGSSGAVSFVMHAALELQQEIVGAAQISFTVIDADTGDPLEATIDVDGDAAEEDLNVVTTSDGFSSIVLIPGSYAVTISAPGYITAQRQVTAAAFEHEQYTIELRSQLGAQQSAQ